MATTTRVASFRNVELVPDGSVEPPGDLIRVGVLFYPGQTSIDVQVRAFVVAGSESEQATPVQSRSVATQDADGYLRIMAQVVCLEHTLFADVDLVVPYADLDLARGEHRLAYEIRGMAGSDVEFIVATRMTLVHVSDTPRSEMQSPVRRMVEETVIEPAQAVVVDGDQYSIVEFTKPKVEHKPVFAIRTSSTPIAGAYDRTEIPDKPSAKGVDNVESYLNELESRPWVPQQKKTVYFATNRNVINAKDNSPNRFGDEAADTITYGSSLVNIPVETHHRGELEVRRWWQWFNPKTHFCVEVLEELTSAVFLDRILQPVRDQAEDILLFVHGFNNTFEFATLRLAQLAHDIRFGGSPIVYSWPSEGSGTRKAYRRDEDRAAESSEALATVLQSLVDGVRRTGRGKIHLAAHSMGNRVLLNALHEARAAWGAGERPFGHIVLAAPDIGVGDFLPLAPSAFGSADSVTMYFCKDDKALKASRVLNLDRRVGDGLVLLAGLDNVDADRANTSFLGHDYFVSRSELLIDLEMLINMGLPPPRRPTLRQTLFKDWVYWLFP